MALDQKDVEYFKKRQTLLKLWPYAGAMCVVGIVGLVAYLYFKVPLLINPLEVMARLEAGSIEQSSLEIMAVILPIVMLATIGVLVFLMIIMYVMCAREKKYLDLINID